MEGRVAIVTGAGSGVGKGTALALLKEGYRVVLAGRREERLREAVAESGCPASVALAVPTDVSNPDSVRRLFARTVEAFGRLDLLFNNAGVSAPATPLDEVSLAQWQAVLDTNLTGTFLCAQQAFRQMKRQAPRGGRIINNGSVSALSPRPNSAAYTAAKHAVTGLTKSMALDGRQFDIACGQINIGNADTAMATTLADGILQANGTVATEPVISVESVVRAVLTMAGLPLDANILFLTVMATKMPFVGRG